MVGDILQPTHLLFVLIVALVVLGPKRLPEVARTLGDGIRDFRNAISGERDDDASQRGETDGPAAYDPYIEHADGPPVEASHPDGHPPVETPHPDDGAPVDAPHPSAMGAPNGAEPAHVAPPPKPVVAPPPKPAEPPRA